MQVTPYVIAYDSTVPTSAKHLMKRGINPKVAVCGVKLERRYMRIVETGETSCAGCALTHAHGIAFMAHRGQTDMDGVAHIEHVKRVADALEGNLEAQVVAWLHDVIEDAGWTTERLREEHFPRVIVEAVYLLTWNKRAMTRDDYITRIVRSGDPAGRLAIRVKLADLEDNIARTKESDAARLARYEGEREKLLRYYGAAA